MEKIIMARCGELMLKGLNRSYFESALRRNIKSAVSGFGNAEVNIAQGRIFIEPADENFKFDNAMKAVSKVFGIVSLSPVLRIPSDYEAIKESSIDMVQNIVSRYGYKTFKVETKRANKSFPYKSPEINSSIGAEILKNVKGLSVDVHNPAFTLHIEIREKTYLYSEIVPAFGGLPVGTNGKAMLLLSGGIDSPVAGWMMAKRGMELEAVHYYSYPYTSERSKDKVMDLVKIISAYCGRIKLHIVPFTDIQLAIHRECPRDEETIIMRRYMMKIAEILSSRNDCMALITGESLGQVASQTIQSIAVTNSAVSIPVFRPLIGLDKDEVVKVARTIGTYETSILPYEDCCTIFVAKHPKTRPILEGIIKSESVLDSERLIQEALANIEVVEIKQG